MAADSTQEVLNFIEHNWFWILIFGGGALEAVSEAFGRGIASVRGPAKKKKKKKKVTATAPAPLPGPCVHRRVAPVMTSDPLEPELVGWVCRNCETRLPADWAVREEDL